MPGQKAICWVRQGQDHSSEIFPETSLMLPSIPSPLPGTLKGSNPNRNMLEKACFPGIMVSRPCKLDSHGSSSHLPCCSQYSLYGTIWDNSPFCSRDFYGRCGARVCVNTEVKPVLSHCIALLLFLSSLFPSPALGYKKYRADYSDWVMIELTWIAHFDGLPLKPIVADRHNSLWWWFQIGNFCELITLMSSRVNLSWIMTPCHPAILWWANLHPLFNTPHVTSSQAFLGYPNASRGGPHSRPWPDPP